MAAAEATDRKKRRRVGIRRWGTKSPPRDPGEQMGSEGVEADIVTRNIMIHGLCKDRRTKETAQFHRDIVLAVVETNTTLVNGYCRAGDVGEAIRLQGADGDVGFCIK